MAKNTTLSDLNAFLGETGGKGTKKIKSAEEFINSQPKNIGETKKLGEDEIKEIILSEATIDDLAVYINDLAKNLGMSYAEVCMEILERGSEITPVLKGGGVVTTFFSAHKTAFNIIKNTIAGKLKK